MANYSEKHGTRNRFSLKRGLSLFMAMILSLSLVQVTALADDVNDQVMKDGGGNKINYVVGSNGEVEKDGGADVTADTTVSDGGYVLSKTITQTSENQFEMMLQVSTAQTVTTTDAAVCLVIDTSGSMAYCAECGGEDSHKDGCVYKSGRYSQVTPEQSRMTAAINEAKAFIDALQSGLTGSAGVYVSVVRFSGYNQSSGSVLVNWSKVTRTSDPVSAFLTSRNLYARGGTNTEAGLLLARNLYHSDAISSVAAENRYTVLLTDGQPTARCTSDHTTLYTIDDYNEGNSGSDTSEAEYNETIAAASAVRAQSKLYTICYGASDDTISFNQTVTVPADGICDLCGKTFAQHTAHTNRDGRTRYYCDANHTNTNNRQFTDESQSTTQTFSVSVGDYLADSIATSGCAYDASNTAQVHQAFSDIATATTTGASGSGTQVVDPMGEFISYVADSARVINGENAQITDGVSASGNTLTWTLDPASAKTSTSGATTTYLYRMQYSITLNTAAEYFQEGTYYPTNGYTYLQSGEDQYAFTVPAVSGTIPTVHYTVEYYKWDKATKDYPATAAETSDPIAVKLWTSVDAPSGYANKYVGDHYSCVNASTQMTITGDGQVMKLYYTPDTATVTVNHYYRTDTIDAAGVRTTGTYGDTPDQDRYTVYVSDAFPAAGQDITKTAGGYTLVTVEDDAGPASDPINSADVYADRTINLYYVQVNDERAKVDVTYQETYITKTWQLDAATGRYVLNVTDSRTDSAVTVASGVPATTTYSYGVDGTKTGGYDLTALSVNGGDAARDADGKVNFTLTSATPNTISATYTKIVDDRGDPVTVTVEHHYTLHTYTSYGDGLTKTDDPEDATGTANVPGTYYAGETFKWSNDLYSTDYDGHTYPAPAAPADRTLSAGGNVIPVYYEDSVYPAEAAFTVTNHYTTWAPEVDPDTGDVNWVVAGTPETVQDTYPASGTTCYVGQTLSVPQLTHGHEGYTVDLMKDVSEVTSDTTITLTGDGDSADVYFDQKQGDAPTVGNVQVIHEYYEDVQCVKDGAVTTEHRLEGSTPPTTLYGAVDEVYNIKPVTDYDSGTGSHSYTRTDSSELNGSFKAGTGDTITLTYTRTGESELKETDLTVTHSYAHKDMTVVDGTAGYYTDAVPDGTSGDYTLKDVNGDPVTTLYEGMAVTVVPVTVYAGETYGNTTDKNTITLGEAGTNSVMLNYVREVPLSKVAIIVNHIYNLLTFSYTGGVESSVTTATYGESNGKTAAEKYVGETYHPAPAPAGYTLRSAADGETPLTAGEDGVYTITASENGNTVTFTYEKSEGDRQAATITVNQHYTLKDWNGETDTTVEGDSMTLTGYVGLPYTAVPNYKTDAGGGNGYTLTGSTATNGFDSGFTITVKPGENVVDLYFEKSIDSRVSTSVNVNHVYYHDAEALAAGTSEGSVSETIPAREFDSYTAALRTSNDGLVYDFANATPENYTISSVNANASENVITINYLRAETAYTVIHRYFTGDSSVADGEIVEEFPGKIGDVVASGSLARITSYNGVTYAFVSANPDSITLAAPAAGETAQVIVLTYRHTQQVTPPYTPGGGDEEGGYKPTTPTTIDEQPTPLAETPQNVNTQPEETTDIPDEETPLAATPAKTGDNLVLWVLAAGVSGIGLVWVSLMGRKRRDDGSQN